MEYSWPGNIRELENLVKRYVIVGNESQIIRELSNHKPMLSPANATLAPIWEPKGNGQPIIHPALPVPVLDTTTILPIAIRPGSESLSLLEIGRRAAMSAEREAIERVLNETRWNRRQAAKILKVSYKALLNKLKVMEEQDNFNKKSANAK